MSTGHRVVTKFIQARSNLLNQAMRGIANDEFGSYHTARVNCRRLRSVMWASLPLWRGKDRDTVQHALSMTKQYAASVSAARDTEALLQLVQHWAEEEQWATNSMAAVERAIIRHDELYPQPEHPEVPADEVMAALRAVQELPAGKLGREDAATAMLVPTRRVATKYLMDVTFAASAVNTSAHIEALHRCRKSVKSLRYVSNLAAKHTPMTRDIVVQARHVQDLLGTLQDADEMVHRLQRSRSIGAKRVSEYATELACDIVAELPEHTAALTAVTLNAILEYDGDISTKVPDLTLGSQSFAKRMVASLAAQQAQRTQHGKAQNGGAAGNGSAGTMAARDTESAATVGS